MLFIICYHKKYYKTNTINIILIIVNILYRGANMNMRQVKYMLTIMEEGNISNAAKKLYISQPSLSQMIKNIEENIGTKLFQKTNPLVLTYAGQIYMDAAKEMNALYKRLNNEISEINNHTRGMLKLGISPQRGMLMIPTLLSKFYSCYPMIEIKLEEAGSIQLENLLLQGVLDLAFITTKPKYNKIEYILIERETIVLLSGKNTEISQHFSPGSQIKIADAKNDNFIAIKPGHSIRNIQDNLFLSSNIAPRIILETSRLETAIRTTLACRAVMICANTYLSNNYGSSVCGNIYPICDNELQRDFYLCYNKDTFLTKPIKYLIEISRKYGELNQWNCI